MKNTTDKIQEFFNIIVKGTRSAVFIGDSSIRDYLCYVIGHNVHMECEGYDILQKANMDNDIIYIIDDVSLKNSYSDKYLLSDNSVLLSAFVDVFNSVNIPKDRPIAFWGGGVEFEKIFRTKSRHLMPEIIIDKNKTGEYCEIPFVSPEAVDFNKYFVIITTIKYAGEIQKVLEEKGCIYGKDYIFGTDLNIINDNAEMFIKTISDSPIKKNACYRPFEYLNVGVDGNITHCCYQWLPKYIGNIMCNDEKPWDTITSRIIRVSFMNCTYSFCNSLCCQFMVKERNKLEAEDIQQDNKEAYLRKQKIEYVDVAFDNTCNLYCKSCRNNMIIDSSTKPTEIANKIKNKLIPSVKRITVAGNGEVFLSKAYKTLLEGNYPNTQLIILSNGNLFTEKSWEMIDGRYNNIHLMFSIDASSKETYEKVRRGGRWENVLRGLTLASTLRKENKIKRLVIRFVVSAENYREMPGFVKLGIKMNCDCVDFSRIENWGTFTNEEFENMSMFIGDVPKPEMASVLENPIFKNKIVNFTNIYFKG